MSTIAWSLKGEDDGIYTSAGEYYDDAPKPLYPEGEPVAKGECVRGWILFDASKDVKMTEIRYRPDSNDSGTWMLK